MLKRLLCAAVILSSFSIYAAGKKDGLHIRYNIESDSGVTPTRSVVDYYYQSGNFLAVVKSLDSTVDEMIFLQKGGQKYTLFPKEKTYVEVKDFEASLSNFHPETEGAFAATQMKKKILGYKCNIHHKEAPTGVTNVCFSALLYKNWKSFSSMIEPNTSAIGQIKGFPIEIVTLTDQQKKQTSIVMSAVRQNDYRKRFEILNGYKKKDTSDVQKSSTKMLNNMKTTVPKSQQELDEMEKMTNEMKKKYQPTKEEIDPIAQ